MHAIWELDADSDIVLGVEVDSCYSDFVMPIAANDTLIAFTDGITESVPLVASVWCRIGAERSLDAGLQRVDDRAGG